MRDTMLLWSSRSTTLEVIKEEVGEMDRTNKDGKNMDENDSEGNDNEDNYTQNCKDEIDEGLDGTEEEKDESNTHESKNEQSEKIENRNRTDHKNVALQKPTLCVTFSEGEDISNSHQGESFDENLVHGYPVALLCAQHHIGTSAAVPKQRNCLVLARQQGLESIAKLIIGHLDGCVKGWHFFPLFAGLLFDSLMLIYYPLLKN